MDHNFTGDPLALLGYWSPQTSAANFCEVDYNVSHYIAEFINTFSNLAFIWQAIVTLPPHLRGHARELAVWKWPVEAWALVFLGLGSGVFHMTLQHRTQIVDESGMYVIVGALDYRIWSHGRSESGKWVLGTALSGMVLGVISWNLLGTHDGKADNNVHLVLFVGLLTALWPRVLHMIKKQSRERKEKQSTKGADEVAKRLMRHFQLGVFYFFLGFGLWLIDGRFCYGLRDTRSIIGLPLGWFLELHGWWHLLTALGAGQFVWVARELTSSSKA